MGKDLQARAPLRWEMGDRIYQEHKWLPGLFVFVYAGVIAVKWLLRLRPQRQ